MKKNSLSVLITTHLYQYPSMELRDVYKLIYQSVMGPAHILEDEAKAFLYLRAEFEDNYQGFEKSLFSDISLEHELVRVHIPIYKNTGSADQLYDMVRQTATRINPNKTVLNNYWNVLGNLIEEHRFVNFSIDDYKTLTNLLQEQDFPHLSHSEKYKKLYKPSYRIVLKEMVKKYSS